MGKSELIKSFFFFFFLEGFFSGEGLLVLQLLQAAQSLYFGNVTFVAGGAGNSDRSYVVFLSELEQAQ